MQRPEDFILGPGAEHECERHGLDPWDVRSARANAILHVTGTFNSDGDWIRVFGETPGGQRLLMTCGPTPNIVATFRPWV
jgi:hypothetical protein